MVLSDDVSVFDNDFNVVYTRVVQGCNLNCDHCFTLGNKDPIGLTSIDLIERYFKVLRKRINPKKAVFYIHGGETFLAPLEYLSEVNRLIRDTFNETKIDIIPQTNLTYPINEGWLDFIMEEYNGTIGVSWDADIRFRSLAQENRFFNNLDKLLDRGIKVHIAITVQKHLLYRDPIEVIKRFDRVDSIDFELLTQFDEKTNNLKVNNEEWSKWYDRVVEYYQNNEVSWSLPMADLLYRSLSAREIHDCKCNCCDRRTFTLNPNGTIGLCPDKTYIEPICNIDEFENDWDLVSDKARDLIINKIVTSHESPLCFSCEFYEYCGGNCELSLFDDTEECPISKRVFKRILDNLPTFHKLYNERAIFKLTELRDDYK